MSRPQSEYPPSAGGETVVPIHGPAKLHRSASVEQNVAAGTPGAAHDPAAKPPPSALPPAFQNDAFFHEKITLPRVHAVHGNETAHFATEEYDNEDRGSLENEEQSYDRTVRYSQSRSGSLPAGRHFTERSSFFDWGSSPRGRYAENLAAAGEGGQHTKFQSDHQLTNAPWSEEIRSAEAGGEYRAEAAAGEYRRDEKLDREHRARHEEDYRRDYRAGHRSHGYRHQYGGAGGDGVLFEEYHDGAVAPYHSSTLRRDAAAAQAAQSAGAGAAATATTQRRSHWSSSQQQQQQRAGGGGSMWGRSTAHKSRGYYRERKYHKVNCCCFSFKWPLWGYEECEPPRSMYVRTQP